MKRLLIPSALLVALAVVACEEPRRFSDDDDDGGTDFTTGSVGTGTSSSGQGGATAGVGAGGVGGAGGTTASTGPTSSTTSSTSSGMADDVCGSGLSYNSNALNACLTASCCIPFDACIADTDCTECVSGSGVDCESNGLFADYTECFDANCPSSFCGSTVGISSGGDPVFACNQCINNFCCEAWDECAPGGGASATDTCIECVNDPSGSICTGASPEVQNGAAAFLECQSSECALECDL